MLNCFGSVRGQGHKIYYFLVQVGAKDKGALQGRGAKNLAPQDSSMECYKSYDINNMHLVFYRHS